jgi:hypothetical protein
MRFSMRIGAHRFQNHVLPFFHRTLCADKACK